MMKLRLFTLAALTLCASSCSVSRDTVPGEDASLKAILSTASTTPGPTGLVQAEVSFEGLEKAKWLTIVKSSVYGNLPTRMAASGISSPFGFEYAIKDTDPESIDFSFYLTGEDGRRGPQSTLEVRNIPKKTTKPLGFSNFRVISRITGKEDNGHDGLPEVEYEVFNNTDKRYDVGGCDLGIVWEIRPGHFGLIFGDTFGSDFTPNLQAPNPGGSNWRGNVLMFSDDTRLDDGLKINGAYTDERGRAKEVCYSAHVTDNVSDFTSIPTGAFHAAGKEYIYYMNIKTWIGWISNFSSYFTSADEGNSWERVEQISFASRSNFGQSGFFVKDGYVYMMGTVTGRSSKPRLARVKEDRVEVQGEYEFWNGYGWTKGRESAAADLFDDYSGELSFAWAPQLGKWIVLYLNEQRNDQIIMRSADNVTGPWSNPVVLTDGNSFWRPYGSFIHPLSLGSGNRLYFVMSAWNAYNTYLISIDIKP